MTQQEPPQLPTGDAPVTSADDKVPSDTTGKEDGATVLMDIDAEPTNETTIDYTMRELRIKEKNCAGILACLSSKCPWIVEKSTNKEDSEKGTTTDGPSSGGTEDNSRTG